MRRIRKANSTTTISAPDHYPRRILWVQHHLSKRYESPSRLAINRDRTGRNRPSLPDPFLANTDRPELRTRVSQVPVALRRTKGIRRNARCCPVLHEPTLARGYNVDGAAPKGTRTAHPLEKPQEIHQGTLRCRRQNGTGQRRAYTLHPRVIAVPRQASPDPTLGMEAYASKRLVALCEHIRQ